MQKNNRGCSVYIWFSNKILFFPYKNSSARKLTWMNLSITRNISLFCFKQVFQDCRKSKKFSNCFYHLLLMILTLFLYLETISPISHIFSPSLSDISSKSIELSFGAEISKPPLVWASDNIFTKDSWSSL